MEFNKSSIPNDISIKLEKQRHMILSPNNAEKVLKTIIAGTSFALLKLILKNYDSKAIIFKTPDDNFLLGAKFEYKNSDWNYTWSFYEDDFKNIESFIFDPDKDEFDSYHKYAKHHYGMVFERSVMIQLFSTVIQCIKDWLINEANNHDTANLSLDGVFEATAKRNANGEIELGLVPSGSMKKVAKDDLSIQNN